MEQTELLLQRLEEIGRSLERSGLALALIGLGSVGIERARLDEYSDLDFYVIAKDGCKERLLERLDWLEAAYPLAYAFQNTADGYKALYADEVFCELAVFERGELEQVPYAEGQVVWKTPDFDEDLARPRWTPPSEQHSIEWMVGEALTCLYVGLGRFRRGEKLSAMRFVQVYAADRVVGLASLLEQAAPAYPDTFSAERRFEQRFPGVAQALPGMLQGYERTPESALAILAFIEAHFEVNPVLKAAILKRCA